MRRAFLAAIAMSPLLGLARPAFAENAVATLCRTNPAYSLPVIQAILAAELQHDHDPALDAEPPDQMAQEAVEQGVKDCATALGSDPATVGVIAGLSGADQRVAWDAYNTSCADRHGSKADCVKAEVGSVRALKRMAARDEPPGSKALVEACELVLKPDPAMADWRECVDEALAAHADSGAANRCKTTVSWHVTSSGADAGHILTACLAAHR